MQHPSVSPHHLVPVQARELTAEEHAERRQACVALDQQVKASHP